MIKRRKEESSIWQILQKSQTIVPIESQSPVVLHLDTKPGDQVLHIDEVQYLAEHSRRLLDGTEYTMKQYPFPTQPNHMPNRRSHERSPFEHRQPIPDPRNTPAPPRENTTPLNDGTTSGCPAVPPRDRDRRLSDFVISPAEFVRGVRIQVIYDGA